MSEYKGRFCGIPGLMWYSKVDQVRGADLQVGQWLDTPDHCGARRIESVDADDQDSPFRVVRFYGGDGESVRKDVSYPVVDPNSQVQPDGSPM